METKSMPGNNPMKLFKTFGVLICLALWLLPAPVQADIVIHVPEEVAVGSPFLVTIHAPPNAGSMNLRWQDRELSTAMVESKHGRTALVLLGAGLNVPPGSHHLRGEVRGPDQIWPWSRQISVQSRQFPEQRLQVAQKMVTPDEHVLPRIQREAELILATLQGISQPRLWEQPFVRPVSGSVSSTFGLRRFFNDQPRSPHRGVDLRGAEGTPVKAFSQGRVVLTGDHYYAGKSVYLDHGQGVFTQYIHLSEINVQEGQKVAAGEIIGKIGSTGRVTGPHLHFGLSILGMRVDPLPLLP